MDKIYLYKRIILISCGILIWTSVLNFIINDSILMSLLFFIPSTILFIYVLKIFRETTIIENSTKGFQSTNNTDVEPIIQKSQETKTQLFEISSQKIPRSKIVTDLGRFALESISKELMLTIGAMYQKTIQNEFSAIVTYAFSEGTELQTFLVGEGFVGQAAKDKKRIIVSEIPEEYPSVISGLGSATPKTLVFIPVSHKDECVAVFELGFFTDLSENEIDSMEDFLEKVITFLHD